MFVVQIMERFPRYPRKQNDLNAALVELSLRLLTYHRKELVEWKTHF